MMIDFNKPELYQTRCGAEFEIYNAERRHGFVKGGMFQWTENGRVYLGGEYHDYDLILQQPEPIVRYIHVWFHRNSADYGGGVSVKSFVDEPIRNHDSYEYTAKITIAGEDITTEIIHRKGEVV